MLTGSNHGKLLYHWLQHPIRNTAMQYWRYQSSVGLHSTVLVQGALEPDFHNLEVFGDIDLAEVLEVVLLVLVNGHHGVLLSIKIW